MPRASFFILSEVQCGMSMLVYGKRAGQNRQVPIVQPFPLASGHCVLVLQTPVLHASCSLELLTAVITQRGPIHDGASCRGLERLQRPTPPQNLSAINGCWGWGSQVHTHPQEYTDC